MSLKIDSSRPTNNAALEGSISTSSIPNRTQRDELFIRQNAEVNTDWSLLSFISIYFTAIVNFFKSMLGYPASGEVLFESVLAEPDEIPLVNNRKRPPTPTVAQQAPLSDDQGG